MTSTLKGLAAGLIIGVLATLLIGSIADGDRDLPEQIAAELGCSSPEDGLHPSTAAAAHHAAGGPNGFSWFAATHATRILAVNGCEATGPAVTYLEFGETVNTDRVLATLDNFGAVCLEDRAMFDGKLLDGREHFEEVCEAVGGELVVLRV